MVRSSDGLASTCNIECVVPANTLTCPFTLQVTSRDVMDTDHGFTFLLDGIDIGVYAHMQCTHEG
jgi:hypothetical protein